MTPVRPKFTNPPLIERAISAVIQPLTDFALGDFGLFWGTIRNQFPSSEVMESVDPFIETYDRFQSTQIGAEFVSTNALPRAAFRNQATGELVQLQNNRIGFNWIKTSDDHKYPHSEATLDRFFTLLHSFDEYVRSNSLGKVQIVQCELTNVNVIPVSDVGESFADMSTVLKLASLESDCATIRLENQLIGSRHLILDDGGEPIGRVHTLGQPTLRVPDNEEAYRLDISARGAPLQPTFEGAREFFDAAASAVNAVFLASITGAGRRFWGETHG